MFHPVVLDTPTGSAAGLVLSQEKSHALTTVTKRLSPRPALFISYRRSQLATVQPLVRTLERVGIECFLDVDDIDPLADFPATIRSAIDRSHAMLLWWSSDYGSSDMCQQEFRYGWQHARRRSSDVARRIWVVNPESGAQHVFAGELNSSNFLNPPLAGAEVGWANSLLEKLVALLPEGPLADEHHTTQTPRLHSVPVMSAEFTGRGRELMSIHSKLHPARIGANLACGVAVQTRGMPGIGKTEVAIAYAREFAMAYPGGVYWLNLAAWNPGDLAREDEAQSAWLGALQETLGLDTERTQALTRDAGGNPLSPASVRDRFAAELSGPDDYLWILDNVPEISPLDVRARSLEFMRAPTANGRTLVTTRDGRIAEGFSGEFLDVLGDEDAVRLLARFRSSSASEEIGALRELVSQVGAHTQALILLGEHARCAPGGFPRVLERLIETGGLERIEQIADALRGLLGAKARGIVATFALSIEKLDGGAKSVLALASVCAPNLPIPEALLFAACDPDREDGFNAAMSWLLRGGLLSRREENVRAVFIHPLVAAAAIHLLEVPVAAFRQFIVHLLNERLSAVGDIRMHARLGDDIQQARELARLRDDHRGILLLIHLQNFDRLRGRLAEARALGQRCLDLATRLLGSEHPDTIAATNDFAVTMFAQGDLRGARSVFENLLPLSRRELGATHHRTIAIMSNLAGAMSALGDHAGARELREAVISTRSEELGARHPQTLSALSKRAVMLLASGDVQSARSACEELVTTLRDVKGDDDPETLIATDTLASVLMTQGELSAARALQEETLLRSRAVFGKEHAITLTFEHNLAQTLFSQGSVGEALATHERILEIRHRVLGESHPDTLSSMGSVGAALAASEQWDRARALQADLLTKQREALGEMHPSTLNTLHNMAQVVHAQGHLEDALALEEPLLSTCREMLGEKHPSTLTVANAVATMWEQHGDLERARALHEATLEIRLEVLGPQHPCTSVSAWALSQLLHVLGEFSAAGRIIDDHLIWLLKCDSAGLGIDHQTIREHLAQLK